jgi:tetratricopeptide (TPR) repeat protein
MIRQLLLSAILLLLMLSLVGCGSLPKTQTESTESSNELVSVPARFQEPLPTALNQLLANAKTLVEKQEYEAADQLLAQGKANFPNFPHLDLNRALIAIKQNDYILAESHIESALSVRPNYPPALNLRGVVYRLSGRFGDAKSAYLSAIEAAPNYANAHLNLGILADLYLHDYALALTSFETYLSLIPDDNKVSNWLVDLKQRISNEGGSQ